MSEVHHTPEPWKVGDGARPLFAWSGQILAEHRLDGTDFILASCNQDYPEEAEANARRIVAAVNACRGIPTEVLEAEDDAPMAVKMSGAQFLKMVFDNDQYRIHCREGQDRALEAEKSAIRERDEARAMVRELADLLNKYAPGPCDCEDCQVKQDLIDRAEDFLEPKNVTCPKCFCVWPGTPDKCAQCGEVLS
jgi:hypothetical protein